MNRQDVEQAVSAAASLALQAAGGHPAMLAFIEAFKQDLLKRLFPEEPVETTGAKVVLRGFEEQ